MLRSTQSAEAIAARRRARSRLVVIAALLLGSLAGSQTSIDASFATASSNAPPTAPSSSASELRLLRLAVNQHRSAIGCNRLIWDERLAALARKYCESMARGKFFGHVDPDGNDPFDRMRDAGIHYRSAGENLAVGQTKGIEVYVDWMNSPKHRAIIEDCVYTHYGVAFYQRRWSYLCVRY
jgi:uncharacterized protein YkwD